MRALHHWCQGGVCYTLLCAATLDCRVHNPDAWLAQDDRDRAAVLDRCAPACLRFVAGLDDGATLRSPSAPAPAAAAGAPKLALVPGTPRSVLPYRRSFSSPDSPLSPCFSLTGSAEGLRGAPQPALREAAARAWPSRGGRGGLAPQGVPGDGRDAGEWAPGWGPAQTACCLSAAWFRERLAANCTRLIPAALLRWPLRSGHLPGWGR